MVMGTPTQEVDLAVVGGGPGGYVAAIRAASLGREVVVVEEREELGGVCLLEGCIPSKALIHVVETLAAAKEAKRMGLTFSGAKIDGEALRSFVKGVVSDLSKGVSGLFKRHGIEVVRGRARFERGDVLAVDGPEPTRLQFKHCIVAAGSRAAELPGSAGLGLWSNREAVGAPEIPERLLVVGAGYIGMELGMVYAGLGSRVTVVELLPQMLTGCDPDLAQIVARSAKKQFEEIVLGAKVAAIDKTSAGYAVRIEKDGAARTLEFDKVLVAVGRKPNTDGLGLENTAIVPDQRGFIHVDERLRTTAPNVYAIGDVTPGPMLAHRASAQGKAAAEVIAGVPGAAFDPRAVPAVVFTDPELAWAGLTETEAKERGIEVKVGKFPFAALGRAKGMGRTDGFAKILCDPASKLVLGVGIVGAHASDLIAEATLAIEMGATIEDLAATIHPHPTLSESLMEAAEVAADAAIHIYAAKK